jgi:hypothetical protein
LLEDRGFEVVLADPPGDSDGGIIEALLEGERLSKRESEKLAQDIWAINEV